MSGHLAVVNAGGWGTALAVLLARGGHAVRLWGRREELARETATTRRSAICWRGVPIPETVEPTAALEEAVDGARAVLLVTISRAARETARAVAPHLATDTPVLHATK